MSTHHALAVASGYGLRVIPVPPYHVSLGPEPHQLDVETDQDGGRYARLTPDLEGGFASQLDQDTESLAQVLDVVPGDPGPWKVQTHLYTFPFPAGLTLHTTPDGDSSPFLLTGPDDLLLFAQLPPGRPRLDDLCAPNHTLEAKGDDWVDVAYTHDGQAWTQRHRLYQVANHVVLVTAQAPAEHAARSRALLADLELTRTQLA